MTESLGVEAAKRVMLEVFTILGEFRDSLTIVGGATPPLLVGDRSADPYAGTLDVGVVIDPVRLPEKTYRTIGEILDRRGYVRGRQPFQWIRSLALDGTDIRVMVDLLSPVTDRRGRSHRHEPIGEDAMARRLPGAEVVRDDYVERDLAGRLPDGRRNEVRVRVAGPAALIVLKALALDGRDNPKDAYDIDYVLAYLEGGPDAAAKQLFGIASEIVTNALAILERKFRSTDSSGPASVATYRGLALASDEANAIQALAFARVRRLLTAYERLAAARAGTPATGRRPEA